MATEGLEDGPEVVAVEPEVVELGLQDAAPRVVLSVAVAEGDEAEEHLATTLRADGVEPPPIALADQAVPPLWEGARP